MEKTSVGAESLATPERSINEHEFIGVKIAQVAEGSPAAIAGLRQGDIITHMNGEPASPAITALSQLAQTGKRISLKVLRKDQDGPVDIALDPIFIEVAGHYKIGVITETHLYVVQKAGVEGEKEICERLIGSYRNSEGQKVCDYAIDIRQEEVPVSFRSDEGTGRLVESIRLSVNGATKDLLAQFNPTNVPILLVSTTYDQQGGEHHPPNPSGEGSKIVVSNIEQPFYIRVLLHELKHERQARDPRWRAYLNAYSLSDFRLDPQKFLTLHPARELGSLKKLVPSLFEGVDDGDVARASDELADMLRDMQKPLKEQQKLKKTIDKPSDLAISNRAQQLLTFLQELSIANPKLAAASTESMPEDTWERVEEKMREVGMNNPSPGRHFLDIYRVALSCCEIDRKGEVEEETFDEESRSLTTTFQPSKSSRRAVTWSFIVSKEELEELDIQRQVLIERYKQLSGLIKEEVEHLETVELRPGLGALSALSYPRWLVEQNAEAGCLLDLRLVRKETGIDLLQALSGLTESDRELLASIQDDRFLEKMTPENKRRLDEYLAEMKKRSIPGKATETVREYINAIGGTHRAMRSMGNAGIKRGF